MSVAPRNKIEEDLEKLQQAYARVFPKDNPYVDLVIQDLAKFCRANESCFHADPRIHAALEGRREVWIRINDHATLSFDELRKRLLSRQQEILRKNNDQPRSTPK